MSTWERRPFSVMDQLRLDPNNVRLDPAIRGAAPEGDILQELFQNENAFDLAKSIATIGFLTHETPTVLPRQDGLWTVVEGNRRTAALKGLINPYAVPGYQPRLSKLVDEHPLPASIGTIECLIAPDKDAADQLVATLHTTNPRKPWGPLRQAEFFAARLDAGKSVEQLIAEYPTIDVAEFVRTAEMYQLLKSVDYADDELARYVARRNFPISTFDRLYTNPDFLNLAKLSVNGTTGQVTLRGRKDDFDALATKIVGDIKGNKINTRKLNKPDEASYKSYMKELSGLEVRSGSSKSVADLPQPQPKPLVAPKPAPTLDVAGLHAPSNFPAIGAILNELGSIRYREYPNATYDLMRTFLEKSIKAYADGLKEEIPKKGQYVYLDSALLWLDSDVKKNKQTKFSQVISLLRSNEKLNPYNYVASADLLNAVNHNHLIAADKDDVLKAWNGMIPLLRYILREDAA